MYWTGFISGVAFVIVASALFVSFKPGAAQKANLKFFKDLYSRKHEKKKR